MPRRRDGGSSTPPRPSSPPTGSPGARVDRVAAAAKVNKAQMYAYYGSKDGLFDAVFSRAARSDHRQRPARRRGPPRLRRRPLRRVPRPPRADPARHLGAARAHADRRSAGPFSGHLTSKLDSIAAAQATGHIDPTLDPGDVYALVTAVSMTWSPASVLVAASRDDDAAEHDRRRRLLAEMAGRMFRPASDRCHRPSWRVEGGVFTDLPYGTVSEHTPFESLRHCQRPAYLGLALAFGFVLRAVGLSRTNRWLVPAGPVTSRTSTYGSDRTSSPSLEWPYSRGSNAAWLLLR